MNDITRIRIALTLLVLLGAAILYGIIHAATAPNTPVITPPVASPYETTIDNEPPATQVATDTTQWQTSTTSPDVKG